MRTNLEAESFLTKANNMMSQRWSLKTASSLSSAFFELAGSSKESVPLSLSNMPPLVLIGNSQFLLLLKLSQSLEIATTWHVSLCRHWLPSVCRSVGGFWSLFHKPFVCCTTCPHGKSAHAVIVWQPRIISFPINSDVSNSLESSWMSPAVNRQST